MHKIIPGQMRLSQVAITLTLVFPTFAIAADVIEELLQEYQSTAESPLSKQQGQELWYSKMNGESCTDCHGSDPAQSGKHQSTGKTIKPMALSINPERFQDISKTRKWFKRNCKQTYKRECTSQEKGNILQWLSDQ